MNSESVYCLTLCFFSPAAMMLCLWNSGSDDCPKATETAMRTLDKKRRLKKQQQLSGDAVVLLFHGFMPNLYSSWRWCKKMKNRTVNKLAKRDGPQIILLPRWEWSLKLYEHKAPNNSYISYDCSFFYILFFKPIDSLCKSKITLQIGLWARDVRL